MNDGFLEGAGKADEAIRDGGDDEGEENEVEDVDERADGLEPAEPEPLGVLGEQQGEAARRHGQREVRPGEVPEAREPRLLARVGFFSFLLHGLGLGPGFMGLFLLAEMRDGDGEGRIYALAAGAAWRGG